MNVIITDEGQVSLAEIKQGDLFSYNNKIYMKTDNTCQGDVLCVHLGTGETLYIIKDRMGNKVKQTEPLKVEVIY